MKTGRNRFHRWFAPLGLLAASLLAGNIAAGGDSLEEVFRHPPREARPDTYWLWLNGYVDSPAAKIELEAMKEAGLGGVLLFEMGARGDPDLRPPPGPAFLSQKWVAQLKETTRIAKSLDLQVDMSVISSWDMGGPWIEPRLASMALYSTETSAEGGRPLDVALPFPRAEKSAPLGPDGKPMFWTDIAVLALHHPRRLPGHEFVIQLDPDGVHELTEIVLDQGHPDAPVDLAATLTPVRDFSVSVSTTGTDDDDFTEIVHGSLPKASGPNRFAPPVGTNARFVRLSLLSGHDSARPHWTLGEFAVMDKNGRNLAGSRVVHEAEDGATLVRAPIPLSYYEWNTENLIDGDLNGASGVFATAGLPPFDLSNAKDVIDVTSSVDRDGHLRWNAPAGDWTFVRYVCMMTGERLKVPSPSSDGLASDHLNPEATRVHMDHVIRQLQAGFGDLRKSGLTHLYLASYEVVGKVWSPVFASEFQRRRGYSLTRFLPAIFGARVDDAQTTSRFLFDYTKTLGEVVVDAYYRTAQTIAHDAGLTIKSEAGGPGPPIHTPPFDALLANGAVDAVQGEFWPYWPKKDAIWVVKEPAAAAHIYGKRVVHLEAFTSFHHWDEGPQDLKASADRAFIEGGNHMVWHTWTHQPTNAGLPGWAYGAGTHLDRNEPWWPMVKPFLDYLSRCSALLQRGQPVGDVLYYYGDGGANFVRPRMDLPGLGRGFDYDVTNADVLLNRLEVRDGRLVLPDGTNYAVLVLPDREDINPAVLKKIERLVEAGATVIGSCPRRASGLENISQADDEVRDIARRLWGENGAAASGSRAWGRGRIFWGMSERAVLAELGIAPDFIGGPALEFVHRSDAEGEIYFMRNRESSPVATSVSFRTNGLSPELWDPASGTIVSATIFRSVDGRLEMPLNLPAQGSVFVVFRRGGSPLASAVSAGTAIELWNGAPALRADHNGQFQITHVDGHQTELKVTGLPEPLKLEGKWTLSFASPLGAPAPLSLRRLRPWTEESDTAVKYFTGAGKYRTTFRVSEEWREKASRVTLDLGDLWVIGEAWLNGKSLGVLWTQPFQVDCTDQLQNGENELVVEVTNTWRNRLIGEARGEVPRATRTNVTVSTWKPWKDLEPIRSGLFGPVRLIPITYREIAR